MLLFILKAMKNFPYKLLFACIFLPPILYIFSISALETYLHNRLSKKIDSILVQDSTALYEGRHSIRDEISRNLGRYLSGRGTSHRLGISLSVMVAAGGNIILYPTQYDYYGAMDSVHDRPDPLSHVRIAEENYRLLSEGLVLSINVRVRHNSWISNGILVIYILSAVFLLSIFIRKGIRESEDMESRQVKALDDLTEKLSARESELSSIKTRESKYRADINELNKERENLSTDIDELLEEMENLETGLNNQKELREKREEEINLLKDEIEGFRNKVVRSKKKSKKNELIEKRFRVLYKNLIFTEKAIEGFLNLTDEFQLKAEEVIQKLDSDDSVINVKRKVFSKGGRINVLEVVFSYSGRIYYQKDSGAKNAIVAIGTKNTQTQDLAFIHREYN